MRPRAISAKTTELGSLVTRLGFEPDLPVRAYYCFDPAPLIVVVAALGLLCATCLSTSR